MRKQLGLLYAEAKVSLACGVVCSRLTKAEREIYFATKLCGYCAHMSERMKED